MSFRANTVRKEVEDKQTSRPKLRLLKGKRRGLKPAQVESIILEHRENGRKLARSLLRRWNVHMPSDEIDSLVDLALCEAGGRFEPDRGAAFMTFFYYHLRGHLVRAVSSAAHSTTIFMAYAQAAGIDISEWSQPAADLDDWQIPELALRHGQEVESPEVSLLKKEEIDTCRSALSKLDSLEQQILSRSYGEDEALVDIARSLGYSRCHISRVKKRALDRLKGLIEGAQVPPSAAQQDGLVETRVIEVRGSIRRGRRRRTLPRRKMQQMLVNNI